MVGRRVNYDGGRKTASERGCSGSKDRVGAICTNDEQRPAGSSDRAETENFVRARDADKAKFTFILFR